MGKGIWFIIIFIILIAILIFSYYKYEKPVKDDSLVIYYTNLTIFTENQNGDEIKTGYEVYLNNSLYDNGITDKYGGVRQLVTTNNTFVIQNKNLENQSFYISKITFSSQNPNKNNRIILELDELGVINITQQGIFGADENIILNLSTNKTFKDMMYCLKWSELLIFVKGSDKLIDDYEDNYKCYETNFDLDETHNYSVLINYNMIKSITSADYIRVSFYDKDENVFNPSYIKRQEYTINSNNI
jgi:hypothetical protein